MVHQQGVVPLQAVVVPREVAVRMADILQTDVLDHTAEVDSTANMTHSADEPRTVEVARIVAVA